MELNNLCKINYNIYSMSNKLNLWKRIKQKKSRECWDSIILSRAIREGLVEKVTFEQRLKKCGNEPLQ